MKFFPEEISMRRVAWLIVHGVFLAVLGILLGLACYDDFKTANETSWKYRNLVGAAAWWMVAIFGFTVTIAGTKRLFRPFSNVEALRNFETIFTGELILLLFSGMILDCGVTQSLVLFSSLMLNLILLAAAPTKLNSEIRIGQFFRKK